MSTEENKNIFSIRTRMRAIRTWGGVAHLFSIAILVLIAVVIYPYESTLFSENMLLSESQTKQRQLLLEALDRIIRYEHYYHEVYGKFTRDITRLALPEKLSHGSFEDVRRKYEISVLEVSANHILLHAIDEKLDRVTIDERHRLNANFILPPPSKAYLMEEADRLISLEVVGRGRLDGLYTSYWKIESEKESSGEKIYARGLRQPVLGEKKERASNAFADAAPNASRGIASIFETVTAKTRTHMGDSGEDFDMESVTALLQQVRFAQHILKRERGFYTKRWEDLQSVTGFPFLAKAKMAKNIRIDPLETTENGYRAVVEGTKGDLMGEQFVMDQTGMIRQVRYTDAIAHQLQESTEILKNTFKFQISEMQGPESQAVLDSKKSRHVESSK